MSSKLDTPNISAITAVVSDLTGMGVHCYTNPEDYGVIVALRLEVVPTTMERVADNIVAAFKKSRIFKDTLDEHAVAIGELRKEIARLQEVNTVLLPYKHYADVAKEIAGNK